MSACHNLEFPKKSLKLSNCLYQAGLGHVSGDCLGIVNGSDDVGRPSPLGVTVFPRGGGRGVTLKLSSGQCSFPSALDCGCDVIGSFRPHLLDDKLLWNSTPSEPFPCVVFLSGC